MRRARGARAYAIRETAEFLGLIAALAIIGRFVPIPFAVWVAVPAVKACFSIALYFAFLRAALRQPPYHAVERLVGRTGLSMTAIGSTGMVKIHGEIWQATSDSGQPIAAGQDVRVKSVSERTLHVTRADAF